MDDIMTVTAITRFLVLFLILIMVPILSPPPLHAQNPGWSGFCQLPGKNVVTQGLSSTTRVQASYPNCTVTVYDAGTITPSTIFSTPGGAALSNPFQANSDGSILFFAAGAPTCYDIVTSPSLSGGTPAMPTPYTYTNQCLSSSTQWSSPPPIGNVTPNTGAFTALTAGSGSFTALTTTTLAATGASSLTGGGTLSLGAAPNILTLISAPTGPHTTTFYGDIDGHVPLVERGNVWTATQNFAAITSSAINGPIGTITPNTGTFTAINGPIGTVTPNTGAFTTACFKGNPWYDVTCYGADRTGATSASAAIQAAIDACAAATNQWGTVYVPGGLYSLTAQLHWKSCSLVGPQSRNALFRWDGAAGATVINRTSDPGGGSFGSLSGIAFENGANKPATWLTFDTLVDQQMHLHELQFVGSTGDAITLPFGWVNVQWDHLRFDHIGGYCIKSTDFALQNQSSWSVSHFTVDSSGATPPGIFGFDNTVAATALPSGVWIDDARIESDNLWAANSGLVVELGNMGAFEFHLSDLQVEIGGGAFAPSYWYWSNNAVGAGLPQISIQRSKQEGLSGYLAATGGIWSGATLPAITLGVTNFTTSAGTEAVQMAEPQTNIVFSSLEDSYRMRQRGDANNRFTISGGGVLNWGDGTAVPDTALRRTGVGLLDTPNSLNIEANLQVGTGITQGGGLKHQRFTGALGGTCPTAAAIGATCLSAGLPWTTAFPDTNYTVNCSIVDPVTGQPHIVFIHKGVASINLTIAADTAAAADVAAAGEVDCIAMHD